MKNNDELNSLLVLINLAYSDHILVDRKKNGLLTKLIA